LHCIIAEGLWAFKHCIYERTNDFETQFPSNRLLLSPQYNTSIFEYNHSSHPIIMATKPEINDQTRSARCLQLRATAQNLPVSLYMDKILKAHAENQVLILVGETGSGKTTQVPPAVTQLLTNNKLKTALTQPRRFACTSVSKRDPISIDLCMGSGIDFRDLDG
jgi:predicted NACHT family NTPase